MVQKFKVGDFVYDKITNPNNIGKHTSFGKIIKKIDNEKFLVQWFFYDGVRVMGYTYPKIKTMHLDHQKVDISVVLENLNKQIDNKIQELNKNKMNLLINLLNAH